MFKKIIAAYSGRLQVISTFRTEVSVILRDTTFPGPKATAAGYRVSVGPACGHGRAQPALPAGPPRVQEGGRALGGHLEIAGGAPELVLGREATGAAPFWPYSRLGSVDVAVSLPRTAQPP